jgi:diadenosine tetraphosphate (Ap4A) HIT family hydrolase
MKSSPNSDCPFCLRLREGRIETDDFLSALFADDHPLTPGHRLVVPKRHVADYFALTEDERWSLWEMVEEAKRRLDGEHHPGGYNLGVNVGAVGGQTVPHVHIPVIPRYQGDREDPRGGVRWIIPEKARYWEE